LWVLRALIGPILFFCAVGLIIYSVRLDSITGGSMEPTLHEGSHVLINALTWHFVGINRGDIIVFINPHDSTQTDVKRVIGLPNEKVLIQGGTISVTNPAGKTTEFPQGTFIGGQGGVGDYSIQLGPEDYFVMGDNRSKSTDSRDFGGVQPSNIIGKVFYSF
jgi:signal peptidase I